MKKSLVAVGVIVALGAAWTGASWYTGSKVEAELSKVVQRTNELLAASVPEAGINLKVEDYKRGILSSDANIVLTSADSASSSDSIVIKTTIDHGPFPVSQLAKFNLMPKLGATNFELVNNKTTEQLFKYTNGKPFISGHTAIGYDKSIDTTVDFQPLDASKETESFKFSGAQLIYAGTADLQEVKASFISDSMSASNKDKTEGMVLSGLKITGDVKKSEYGFYTGTQNLTINNIKFDSSDIAFSFNNLKFDSDTSIVGKDAKGSLSYSIDDLVAAGQNLGSGKMTMAMDRISADALGKFITDYNEAITQSLADGSLPYVADQLAMRMLATSLPELMKSNPQFALSPISWKNAAGESTFDLKIDFNAWTADELTSLAMSNKSDEAMKKLFKDVDLNIKLSKPMIIESMTQSRIIDSGKTPTAEEKAEYIKAATEEFNSAQEMLTSDMFSSPYEDMFLTDEQRAEKAKQKASPWMLYANDALTMSFKFNGSEIIVNGEKFTLVDFLTKMKVMQPTAVDAPQEAIDTPAPAVAE